MPFGGGLEIGDAGPLVRRVVAGDLDHDGDADLVAAVEGATAISAWQNPGPPLSPTWTPGTVGAPGATTYSLALGDLDHDGNLDVASGSGGAAAWEVMVWRNDGTPFDGAWAGTGVGGAGNVYALVAGDLDNDGDLDLVSGTDDAVITAWQNDGTPFDAAWSSNFVGNTVSAAHSLALGDLDNDGDLDLVSGDANNRVRVWSNDGSPFSGPWSALTALTALDVVYAVSLADLDGDGHLDIAAACGTAEDNELVVLRNDGTPFSGAWTSQDAGKLMAAPYALVSDDLDVDGDPDLALGTDLWSGQPEVWVWENDGFPFASSWKGSGIGETGAIAGALANADLDGDGDPDLVSGLGTGMLVAWPNLRPAAALGNWTEAPQPAPVYASLGVDVADLDHDGRADLASGADDKGIVAWWGDGGYTWERLGATELPDVGTFADVAFGQLNNRTELDLAAADQAGGLKAWLAWERGTVWDDHYTGLPVSGRYEAVALGHLDHDGRLDLAAAGIDTGLGTWQGTGDLVTHWNLKATYDGTGDYCDVALGLVNHDGYLDLVGANCGGGGLPVLFNDGGFGLNKGLPPDESGSYLAVALGDVNHDGNLDVAAAPLAGGVQVWLGDGGTSWTPAEPAGPETTVLSLDLADFDNDGYLDLLAGYKEAGVRVWKGDGGKSWTDASLNLPTSGEFSGVRFGRVDADAHLDIAAAESSGSGVRVWTATEPPPGGWDDFLPETNPPWVWSPDQTPDCSV
ncbi:MAG: FG-GAP repeat domain-containing protein, partial [Anaerolineae bacterium]